MWWIKCLYVYIGQFNLVICSQQIFLVDNILLDVYLFWIFIWKSPIFRILKYHLKFDAKCLRIFVVSLRNISDLTQWLKET